MANILKAIYQGDNFKPNSKTIEITMTLDSDITIGDINLYLPNNGDKYQEIEGIAYLPTGSSAKIYTPSYLFMCNFVAENGNINNQTQLQEGTWRCLAKCDWEV